MKTPLYKQAFSHSWRLAWKHHALWPLGLFAAVLGQMGIVDFLTQSWFTARGYRPGEGWSLLLSLLKSDLQSGVVSGGVFAWIVLLGITLFGVWLLFLFVSVVSQGALVDIVARSTKKKQLPDVGPSWHVGVSHAGRVFFVHVCKKVILALAGIAVAVSAYPLLLGTAGSPVVFLLVFLAASFVGIVVSFLAVYTIGYIVVEEYRFGEAVVAAWRLFVEHWLVSLEVGLFLFGINIFVAFLVVVALFVSLVPAFFSYLFALLFTSGSIFAFGIAISATLFLILFFLIASVFSVFVISPWTYLFMQMHKTGLRSHILHWLR